MILSSSRHLDVFFIFYFFKDRNNYDQKYFSPYHSIQQKKQITQELFHYLKVLSLFYKKEADICISGACELVLELRQALRGNCANTMLSTFSNGKLCSSKQPALANRRWETCSSNPGPCVNLLYTHGQMAVFLNNNKRTENDGDECKWVKLRSTRNTWRKLNNIQPSHPKN